MHTLKRLLQISFVFLSYLACSHSKEAVNILVWWDFINEPAAIRQIEETCNVTLSLDEYYADAEFLRRFEKQADQYDVIIFSDVTLSAIKDNLAKRDIDVSDTAKQYYPAIYTAYKEANHPKNVLYFSQYIKVVLWNPKRVQLTEEDTVRSIFQKSEGNLVILLNDPFELYEITKLYNKENVTFESTLDELGKKYQLRFSNEISNLYNNNQFAFAVTWSSTGMSIIRRFNNNYRLLSLKEFDLLSSDLIAVLNKKASSMCVMKQLSSEDIIRTIQKNNPFLSPYDAYQSIPSAAHRAFYKDALGDLSTITWEKMPSEEKYWDTYNQWNKFKTEYEYF